jgi:hypothetical protein
MWRSAKARRPLPAAGPASLSLARALCRSWWNRPCNTRCTLRLFERDGWLQKRSGAGTASAGSVWSIAQLSQHTGVIDVLPCPCQVVTFHIKEYKASLFGSHPPCAFVIPLSCRSPSSVLHLLIGLIQAPLGLKPLDHGAGHLVTLPFCKCRYLSLSWLPTLPPWHRLRL